MALQPDPNLPRPASLNSASDDYFTRIWDQALRDVEVQLGSHDYHNLNKFKNLDELLKTIEQRTDKYSKRTIPILLNKLKPCLGRLQGFTTVVAIVLRGPIIQTAIVWGMLNLLFELSRVSEDVYSKIVDTLEQMVNDLSVFQEYEYIFKDKENADLEETLIKAFVDMIKYLSGVIHYLRHSSLGNMVNSFSAVQSQLRDARVQIQMQTSRLIQRAQARALAVQSRTQVDLLRELEDRFGTKLSLTQTMSDNSGFSCNNIIRPKDPHFYGRETILGEIHQMLDHKETEVEFRSWALWGMAGIGKTQTALHYAQQRIAEGVPAVFWIKGDTALNIDSSFTGIALKLDLKGAVENGDHVHNRFLVTTWLRETKLNWLIVFDNVDNPNHLRDCWPSAKHGSILITSRSQVVCTNPAAGGRLMPSFTAEEGSRCLMKFLARDQYSKEEEASAKAFSDVVGGLPLALALMGTQIRRRGKQIQQFLMQYEKDPARLHQTPKTGVESLYYDKGLDTVWQESFGSLGLDSLALLGTMSFFAADDIPNSFFVSCDSKSLPPSLAFCSDEFSFDDALEPLLESSLVRKDSDSQMMYMHRLIQEEFRNWSGSDKCFEHFRAAAKLLFEAFPKHRNGMGMRNSWTACQQGIGHVLSLCDRYRHAQYSQVLPGGDLQVFSELLTSSGWYLMEKGSWSEFMDLMATAELACEDKEGLVWAHLCNTAGCVEYERGNAARSYPYMNKSREIRERLLPPDHLEVSDAWNNYGNLLMTDSESEENLEKALQLYLKTLDIGKHTPDGKKVLHTRYMNAGAAYAFQGRYDLAVTHYELAREYAIATFGAGRHFDGRVDFLKARNHYRQRQWEDAKRLFERALKIFEAENATHHGVAATELKLACIALRQGRVDEAISKLNKAKLIAELNEKGRGDKGDIARMLRQLAEAYEMKGDYDEAARLKKDAEGIRQEVQGSRFAHLPDTESSYDLMVFHGDR